MNIVILSSYTGTPDADDIRAAYHSVALENRRLSELTPPGTPLPTSSVVLLKTSYLGILSQKAADFHQLMVEYSKTAAGLNQRFTPDQVLQMHANLVARLNAGESAAAIVADTAA
jgi:hypothetical protein